jgi:hypothetical protein
MAALAWRKESITPKRTARYGRFLPVFSGKKHKIAFSLTRACRLFLVSFFFFVCDFVTIRGYGGQAL